MSKYRVWCLSWEDTEANGHDVVSYRLIDGPPATPEKRTLYSWQVDDAESAAEAYAEYVHGHRDGWEDTWPLTFRVSSPDGTEQDFEVDCQNEPTFSASAVRKATP